MFLPFQAIVAKQICFCTPANHTDALRSLQWRANQIERLFVDLRQAKVKQGEMGLVCIWHQRYSGGGAT